MNSSREVASGQQVKLLVLLSTQLSKRSNYIDVDLIETEIWNRYLISEVLSAKNLLSDAQPQTAGSDSAMLAT